VEEGRYQSADAPLFANALLSSCNNQLAAVLGPRIEVIVR
jgi:hypothetical protein